MGRIVRTKLRTRISSSISPPPPTMQQEPGNPHVESLSTKSFKVSLKYII